MKRITAFFLSCVLILSLVGNVYAISDQNEDVIAVKNTVEEFLSKATRKVYFYEPQDTAILTTKTLSANEKIAIATDLEAQTNIFTFTEKKQEVQNDSILPLMEANIDFFEDGLTYFSHVYETEGITYSWFEEKYVYEDISIDSDLATVCVYQELNYQYSDCDMPTSEIITYNIVLAKANDSWYIANVNSDSDFNLSYNVETFNLSEELTSFDEAISKPGSIISASNELIGEDEAIIPMATSNSIPYNGKNAANYALTYSTQSDSGSIPSYKNKNFYWTNTSCMLFASQSIWAGFRGNNTKSSINEKQNMDNGTPNTWYSTSSSATTSWTSCQFFRDYVTASNKSSDTSVGLTTKTLYVESDQNTVTGVAGVDVDWTTDAYIDKNYDGHYYLSGTKSTPFTATDLVGAIIHGHGKDGNGNPGILGHALICNNATGITRDTIYVTCYNSCRKNKLLSLVYPVGYTNHHDLYFIVPTALRTNETGTHLYAKLENAWIVGKTLTLTGCSSAPVSSLTISVYKEGSTTAEASTTRNNVVTVLQEFTFSSAGTWRIEVSSPGLTTFTYTVRIVDQ